MTNEKRKTTTLNELGPDELYRRGKDVVLGSDLKIGETIVIDGWPYLIVTELEAMTKIAASHGWEGWQTGGGCTALSKTLGVDSYALITQKDNPSHPETTSDLVDLFFYYPEDDPQNRDFDELGHGIPFFDAVKFDFAQQIIAADADGPSDDADDDPEFIETIKEEN